MNHKELLSRKTTGKGPLMREGILLKTLPAQSGESGGETRRLSETETLPAQLPKRKTKVGLGKSNLGESLWVGEKKGA